jgi:hypothetical protein
VAKSHQKAEYIQHRTKKGEIKQRNEQTHPTHIQKKKIKK